MHRGPVDSDRGQTAVREAEDGLFQGSVVADEGRVGDGVVVAWGKKHAPGFEGEGDEGLEGEVCVEGAGRLGCRNDAAGRRGKCGDEGRED